MQLDFRLYFRPKLFFILILVLAACTPAAPTDLPQPTETQSQASPTAEEPTAEPTEPEFQAGSPGTQLQADLTVVESSVKVLKSTEVQQDQTVSVQVNDQIEMAQASRSILNFSDSLEIELFRNARVRIADVIQESGGSTDVTLNLNQGHIFVRLNDQAFSSRVTVETPYAIIRAREDGTDFDICHNEALTCVWIKKGVAEVIAKDQKVIVRGGEASYIHKDQPPSPAICAPIEIFSAWEENYRASAETPALGKMVQELPQEPCAATILELPSNARIIYEDDFTKLSSEWPQAQIDNYIIGYSEPAEYYHVQILSPSDKYPVYVPNKKKYTDVNIDLAVFTEAASDGDFRYGLLFRRSGDQYYAFTISPRTKTWNVLKSSSNALEIINEGIEDSIQGLVAKDVLRVEAKGSTFSLYINGRQVGQISDSAYTSGEVGLYVQTLDSPEARINFDSIIIWDMQAPVLSPTQRAREICNNNKDDDGDGLIDKADPDCQKPDVLPTPTPLPPPTDTLLPPPTHTPEPQPTETPEPQPTETPGP